MIKITAFLWYHELHYNMIRIRPNEWLHMEFKGSGKINNTQKISGTLYMTNRRVVIQGSDGPIWTGLIKDMTVSVENDICHMKVGRDDVTWKSSTIPVSWWGNAIMFWKKGTILAPDGGEPSHNYGIYPPVYNDITELPDLIKNSEWNIRWYTKDELEQCGMGTPENSDGFERTVYKTNLILAALRHDGFPQGPPNTHLRMLHRRHALVHVTYLVWGWKQGIRHMMTRVTGYGHYAGDGQIAMYRQPPDKMFEPKPFSPIKREWHHEINPAHCGGHTYEILETCHRMLPIITRVADELHADPTWHPYIRLRQIYEAIRDDKAIPPPVKEALPLARAATDNPW